MNCWICHEHAACPYPVCYEQETTEQIKTEQLEMGFIDREEQSREPQK